MIRNMMTLTMTLVLAAATLSATESRKQSMNDREIQALAQKAKTQAEHEEVARQYELRGKFFETKATRHETEADELSKRGGYNPMAHKWPAMVQAPIDRARANAMQARRAARESFELAAKHRDLAVKATAIAAE